MEASFGGSGPVMAAHAVMNTSVIQTEDVRMYESSHPLGQPSARPAPLDNSFSANSQLLRLPTDGFHGVSTAARPGFMSPTSASYSNGMDVDDDTGRQAIWEASGPNMRSDMVVDMLSSIMAAVSEQPSLGGQHAGAYAHKASNRISELEADVAAILNAPTAPKPATVENRWR